MRISDWSSDVCSSDLRIGVPAATGITNRRDMVDVHTQPEITLHHVKPHRIFPYTQLYHAPVGPRSACSAARQKARRASPRPVSTASTHHRLDDRGRTHGRDDVSEVLEDRQATVRGNSGTDG